MYLSRNFQLSPEAIFRLRVPFFDRVKSDRRHYSVRRGSAFCVSVRLIPHVVAGKAGALSGFVGSDPIPSDM